MGLFSKLILPLCSMQGNNGFWAKNFENHILIQFLTSPARSSTSEFCQVPNLQCELLRV